MVTAKSNYLDSSWYTFCICDLLLLFFFFLVNANTALNEALRKELERMKIETGEISGNSDSFDMGMQQVQYSPSTFMAIPPYHHGQDMQQMHGFNPSHPMEAMSNSQSVSEFLQNGRMQGLEISSNNSSSLVKSEGPSLSASESSSAY